MVTDTFKIPVVLYDDPTDEMVEIISGRGDETRIRCTKEESIRLARNILRKFGAQQ